MEDHAALHEHVTAVLMWATILGWSVLVLSGLVWIGVRSRIHAIRARLYGVEPRSIDLISYAYLGVMKLVVILCFLIPWLAMVIVGT